MPPAHGKEHWDKVYATTPPDRVSWYRPHLEISLSLIERGAGGRSAAIIDVGGGESTLVDDLLRRGYQNLTLLDISPTAIDVARKRLKEQAELVRSAVSWRRSEEHTSELQSHVNLVCRLLLEKKKNN